ncbi:flagellar motility protein MotE (MotC chaperone) [Alkalibacillus flavidus]|uniref:Flagellar motility protein MotE (MotC chaperone) n=1 Tax=Alkalibacillus flavidus TaxID=546021 RepID=A0ABV2KRD3_9BACI
MATGQNKENASKLQWFLFVIVIPIIFAVTLVLIIATFAGVNPIEKAREYGSQMPIVNSFVTSPEEENYEEQLANYEATVQDQEATISEQEATINSQTQEIEELNAQIAQLQEQLEEDQNDQASRDETVSRLTRSFSEMDATRAAEVMTEMEQAVVLDVLAQMNDTARGSILAEMDPELAANLSNALVQRSNAE